MPKFFHICDLCASVAALTLIPIWLYVEGDSKTRDFTAASSYYKQAATLMPSSGNPHHQLAILASYFGDELLAVYRYFRSLAVHTPFITARDNLIIAFEKVSTYYC